MTQLKKRAVFNLIIWGIAFLAFLPVFFSGGGPDAYHIEKQRILWMAIIFGAAYSAYFLMMFLTRAERGVNIVRDERDDATGRKASQTALIIVLIYVYATSLTLYEAYHNQGSVPIGWMWFLGYTTIFLANIASAAAALIFDARTGGNA